MKFKVGDNIRDKDTKETGIVTSYSPCGEYVRINGGTSGTRDRCFELIESKSKIMKKLTPMLKTMLDKKGRTLYKAEFLNGDLELTEEGKSALMTILFEANKEELVKVAEDVIKEEKE